MRHYGLRRGAASRRTVAARPAAIRLGALAGGLAASLLLVSACGGGGSAAPGDGGEATSAVPAAEVLGPVAKATGEPVRIGLISDGKSAILDQSVEFEVGKAAARYLNEHRSGIAGRPIELVTCEAQSDPSKTSDCANSMIEQDVVAVVVGGVAAQEAAWTPLHDAGVPTVLYSTSTPTLLRDAENTFVLADSTFGTVGLPIELAKQAGVKKVTAVVIDVPAAKGVLEASAPAAYEKAGIDFEMVAVAPGTADMTPQMQQIAAGSGGVFILGNDSFCISALNGLRAVGFSGQISAIAQCITDATRTAVPGDMLKGISLAATAPLGTDNPSTQLYNAVAATYGKDIDTSKIAGINTFMAVAGLQAALEDLTGDVTPATVLAAIKAMQQKELPGGGGQRFQCGGKAVPASPAACVSGGLITELDDKGQPTTYEVAGA
ncbi:ABC transporter substrate-binding protein [Frankia sp. CNm7]|uniref:ABC transporter substrate-binding protein n=1 Tax=Frankia nepalensis TaxID=1836974 RepID=A0A937RP29_9ACTN|nr:ABC transporter substrate-binding protein [Frankia nepalensis]MBL7499655.1 ABC transporter substrate-binding protein [Frankia nepalensis]MBL7515685.1 ABC transporter substrate-binding protein [Frankia nepalensis]MBL7519337.1 ABC transporter substrate-binding protein [Frankia nepalensis]MBL7629381.1 ABC transporter substrate-binding protein [Frankia nepalensis]